MPKEKNLGVRYYLTQDNIQTLIKYKNEHSVDYATALNQIIREWSEGKEIEPVNSDLKLSDLRGLQNSLDCIDARLSWIEGQLADASFCDYKKEVKSQF